MANLKNIDWYEDQLERDDLSLEQREEYEATANRLAESYRKTHANIKKRSGF
jgi:hypothetical protein